MNSVERDLRRRIPLYKLNRRNWNLKEGVGFFCYTLLPTKRCFFLFIQTFSVIFEVSVWKSIIFQQFWQYTSSPGFPRYIISATILHLSVTEACARF
jgi:hypothetical protein